MQGHCRSDHPMSTRKDSERWRAKQLVRGNCACCGRKRKRLGYYCEVCLAKRRARANDRREAAKKWEEHYGDKQSG